MNSGLNDYKDIILIEGLICKEHYVAEQKFSSRRKKGENYLREARAKAGLAMDTDDMKSSGVEF